MPRIGEDRHVLPGASHAGQVIARRPRACASERLERELNVVGHL
jgi:hypothetical protein